VFKHILIPTDGSPVAAKAAKAGLAFAHEIGARVTGYCAVEPLSSHLYGEGYIVDGKLLDEFERRAREIGERYVAGIGKAAEAAGVPFEPLVTTADAPYSGIIAAAKEHRCDAIFMASHGRRGLAGLVIGSVTHKVLTHSTIPVLVYR
jgi:nucleotide-binding universal stress UspA family protein